MSSQPAYDHVQAEIDREFPAEYDAPQYEIADIFQHYGAHYRNNHPMGGERLAAMTAIERCRTTALGGHINHCSDCGYTDISYNSCRNRNCPKCRGSQRAAWVEARELELLPIQYFHIVFTLPQQLVPLARYNPRLLYNLLFRITAETLQGFAHKQWGAQLGIIMALHTWGQTLNDHPHVHCIVSGGALKKDHSTFVRAPQNFLFQVQALSRVFREKYLNALTKLHKKGQLELNGQPQLNSEPGWQNLLNQLRHHQWVVYAKHPLDKPQHIIRYLGRYINRIAIANYRIKAIENNNIAFTYKDYRDEQEKIMVLPADTFISRFLSHILPRGYRRVRYYGFLVNSLRDKRLPLIRSLLELPQPDAPYIPDIEAYLDRQVAKDALHCCPNCIGENYRSTFTLLSFHDPPDELLEGGIK